MSKRLSFIAFGLLSITSLVLGACQPQTVEREVLVTQEVEVEVEVTRQVEVETVVTATPEPIPTGGAVVFALSTEPDTFDPSRTVFANVEFILRYAAATLITRDPEGNFVPYLAESWDISEDGLTWDFTLRQDVKFHDGTPLTAHDFVYTFDRIMNSGLTRGAITFIQQLESSEALDDYTLRLNLSEPNFPFLLNLTLANLSPLPAHVIEQVGDEEFGRKPVLTGPYMIGEWVTGDRVVLQRNPDFNWGPPFAHEGPAYIETLVFRILPEPSTILAGLESGELDAVVLGAALTGRDATRIRLTDRYEMGAGLFQGQRNLLFMNVEKEPFIDERVRKAFNLALDKEFILDVIADGDGFIQYGPITAAVNGYWPGVEEIGYRYDLEQAKMLMGEAGYTAGGSGLLEKDGVPLRLTLKATAAEQTLAELMQEMYGQLGVEIEIELLENTVLLEQARAGEFTLQIRGFSGPDADLLVLFFHSQYFGGPNLMRIVDAELDSILEMTRTELDPAKRQEAVNSALEYIIEHAYGAPTVLPTQYYPMSQRVRDAAWSVSETRWYLDDAYILEGD